MEAPYHNQNVLKSVTDAPLIIWVSGQDAQGKQYYWTITTNIANDTEWLIARIDRLIDD